MTDNIIVRALQAEFTRVKGKNEGAQSRLVHAQTQVAVETKMLGETRTELDQLAKAITHHGGVVPPEGPTQ